MVLGDLLYLLMEQVVLTSTSLNHNLIRAHTEPTGAPFFWTLSTSPQSLRATFDAGLTGDLDQALAAAAAIVFWALVAVAGAGVAVSALSHARPSLGMQAAAVAILTTAALALADFAAWTLAVFLPGHNRHGSSYLGQVYPAYLPTATKLDLCEQLVQAALAKPATGTSPPPPPADAAMMELRLNEGLAACLNTTHPTILAGDDLRGNRLWEVAGAACAGLPPGVGCPIPTTPASPLSTRLLLLLYWGVVSVAAIVLQGWLAPGSTHSTQGAQSSSRARGPQGHPKGGKQQHKGRGAGQDSKGVSGNGGTVNDADAPDGGSNRAGGGDLRGRVPLTLVRKGYHVMALALFVPALVVDPEMLVVGSVAAGVVCFCSC